MTVIDQDGNAVSCEIEVADQLRHLRPLSGEMQAMGVSVMLSDARTGLLAASAAQDLPGIVEFKAKASAIYEITKQLKLGRDIQDDAAEFMRRAERGLGVAIREGQERGEIMKRGDKKSSGNQWISGDQRQSVTSKDAPTDFATQSDLSGGRGDGIYAMTDGVSDDQFEEALTEAREEGNLSRANVARKTKAKAAEARGEEVAPGITADELEDLQVPTKPKTRNRYNGTEILENTSFTLEGLRSGLELVTAGNTDLQAARESIDSIKETITIIRRKLKEITK